MQSQNTLPTDLEDGVSGPAVGHPERAPAGRLTLDRGSLGRHTGVIASLRR